MFVCLGYLLICLKASEVNCQTVFHQTLSGCLSPKPNKTDNNRYKKWQTYKRVCIQNEAAIECFIFKNQWMIRTGPSGNNLFVYGHFIFDERTTATTYRTPDHLHPKIFYLTAIIYKPIVNLYYSSSHKATWKVIFKVIFSKLKLMKTYQRSFMSH